MAADVHIGSIETSISAVDPATVATPEFVHRIVQLVKAELEADQRVKERREFDSATRVKRAL